VHLQHSLPLYTTNNPQFADPPMVSWVQSYTGLPRSSPTPPPSLLNPKNNNIKIKIIKIIIYIYME
jgi:hypothetical protein